MDIQTFYGWHISNLKIYDKPKALNEFCVADLKKDKECKHKELLYANPNYTNGGTLNGGFYCKKRNDFCRGCHTKQLQKPPQSWCYVEEVQV